MCGIVSIFAYNASAPTVDRDELLKIREAMIVRGPDGAGEWISPDNRIGLAHRRLAIIEISEAGAQPMQDVTGKYSIVFNGEIYNFREIKLELEKRGFRFRSNSDTEVLLNLYADKGPAMVNDLRGMFAFALWDHEKKELFLARDPYGIKPLYYADDGKTIRVASQVKALLKGGRVNTELEPAGKVGFFIWGSVPEPFTLFKGIRALPAGSSLLIADNGKKECNNYCSISAEMKPAKPIGEDRTIDRHVEIRGALLDSIRHHLVADVPVGVFLSAGRDSTTITALTSEIIPKNLCTVTLGFEEYKGTPDDETTLAEIVARKYGTDHQTIWISKQEFYDDFGHIILSMDQPSIDGINTYYVSKAAAKAGLKVALSGLGADELFGGYPGFKEIPWIVGLIGNTPCLSRYGSFFRKASIPIIDKFVNPKFAGIFEYGKDFGTAYLLRRSLYMPWELNEFLDLDIIKKGLEDLQTIPSLNFITQSITDPKLKVSALESCWYMRNQLLRDSDWAGMAHSLEIRVPFVDIELLRKINRISPHGIITKSEMAATPVRKLPSCILNRPKTGFNIPTKQWTGGFSTRGLHSWAQKIMKDYLR
jgi:asparagine synthase (glutamine-hydrolysing)